MTAKVAESFVIMTIILTLSIVPSEPQNHDATDDIGQPLILTPMIEKGDIRSAQDLCKVNPLQGNIASYAGFFTVNATYNSNLFFWFFPASEDDETAPVIVWLDGGPGLTSLLSVFIEIGPYLITENLSLELREPSVTNHYSVIFIDNPVGTGYSFTEDDRGYSTNERDIGSNLYSALVQFFTLFPKYQANDFYALGESYGGKYVTAVSHVILKNNPSAEVTINLKGLLIGNGFLDPQHMVHFGDYYYQIGLVDIDGKEQLWNAEQQIVRLIRKEKYLKAFNVLDRTIVGYLSSTTLLRNLTGFNYLLNFLYTNNNVDTSNVPTFLTQPNIRKAIHVGNASFNYTSYVVFNNIRGDFTRSVKPWFEEVLENYRVILFNGQLDLLVPYVLTERFVATLQWSGLQEYNSAPRTQWYVGRDLAGYSKDGGNLNFVLVRNAGHSSAVEQPEWTLDLITRFIRNEPFSGPSP